MKNGSHSDSRRGGSLLARERRSPATVSPKLAALFSGAVALHQAGRLLEAEPLYREVLRAQPRHFDCLHLLGVIHYQRGEFDQAVRQIDAALKINPGVAAAHNNRGNALKDLGRLQEAIESYRRATALKPDYAEAFYNCANVLRESERFEEAVENYDRAVALKADYADAFNNRGSARKGLEEFEEALADYDRAIALKGDYAEAWYNRGNALNKLRRFEEALASCDKAIALKPDLAEAFNNRGNALKKLRRFEEALASYDRAVALKPDYADAYNNRGIVLGELERNDEALASYEKAIALKPDHAEAFYSRATTLLAARRLDEAVASLDKAISLKLDLDYLKGLHFYLKMQLCDWTGFGAEVAELNAAVADGRAASHPFSLLSFATSPAALLKCARIYTANECPVYAEPIWRGERYAHERLRVAYLSADFREHPVAHLTAGLFGRHDRSRFETIGISSGPDKPSPMRARLKASFDRFLDVHTMGDREVAELIRELEVDIAVDLTGLTDGARPNILAQRPAPIQVNYLGFAGTLGQDYCDYIIADRFVIPETSCDDYVEKIVYLPDCYMVNDADRAISASTPTRAQAGLPETGFVFCCFNNSYKITPDVFDVWMRLLGQVDGSVLWLSSSNAIAPGNLRREAEKRGIAGDRLVFAPKVVLNEDHLARNRLADLFLDTLYYNAHTTAADALWAGVPVLTCSGATFASRVAGSLLHTIGLPELVTASLADYEAMALKLAREPVLLSSLWDKLARNREVYPLFDTDRFTRHLEAAFTIMRERAQRGEPPQSFTVGSIERSAA